LHLPGKALKALRDFYDDEDVSWRQLEFLEKEYEVIHYNEWAGRGGNWELTKKGKIPFGELSLLLFNQFQEPLLIEKHDQLEAAAEKARGTVDFQTRLTDLRLYRAQYRRILSCTLYFLRINDGQFYKIGVSTRDTDSRIAEIRDDLKVHIGDAKIDVLGTWPWRGNVELYFKHRYAKYNQPIGPLTEYFTFENIKPVLLDLRRMKPKELTPLEQGILAGDHSRLEETLRLEDIEQRRRVAIVAGMKRAAKRGKHIGRPTGTTPHEAFLIKPNSILVQEALAQGLSLRQAARYASVSVNTVRKVKEAMEARDKQGALWNEKPTTS
jgi:hypothetical protein